MKGKILKELLDNKGEFISGQMLSRNFEISRTAVWKYINALKEDGYVIEAVPNKGYRLIEAPDLIVPEEIKTMLKTSFVGNNIIYKERIGSTSDYAKKIALTAGEGTVIIAEEQTEGRGRMGRRWISPPGTGIWMSIILKPKLNPAKAYQITQAIAVAAAKAIKETCGLNAGIKWPNDIIVNGKKVCGILTEMSAESDQIYYIVIGVGVNVNTSLDDIPPELRAKASSLKEELGRYVSRKKLLANMLNWVEEIYLKFVNNGFGAVIKDCRELSVILGKEVEVIQTDQKYRGRALKIREDGILLIETQEGIKEILSGDVSIRGTGGYI